MIPYVRWQADLMFWYACYRFVENRSTGIASAETTVTYSSAIGVITFHPEPSYNDLHHWAVYAKHTRLATIEYNQKTGVVEIR